MTEINELLQQYVDNNKDVTFPIDHRDAGNVLPTSTYYGFSPDGSTFNTHWALRFNGSTRVTAAFTGVIYMRSSSPGSPVILLKIFSSPPLNRVDGLPSWYPLPKLARYSSFTEPQFRILIENLFTDDRGRISGLVGSGAEDIDRRLRENRNRLATVREYYRSANGLADDVSVEVNTLVVDFMNGRLDSGIPVSAGTVLYTTSGELSFYLHPLDGINPVETLFFNPNFYFKKWERRIENLRSFPTRFRELPLAPPVSTGNVLYVSQTPRSGISPIHRDLFGATQLANENDTVLILDKGTYQLNLINKFVSVLALLAPTDEKDVKEFDRHIYNPERPENYVGSPLFLDLRRNYPTITNSTSGSRGITIQYHGGAPEPYGIIYLSNVVIAGNVLNIDLERHREGVGGAGMLISGVYFRSVGGELEETGSDFSQVHIHNCAIVHNRMDNFPLRVPPGEIKPGVSYCGGGISCYFSSPLISSCLIKGNSSYFHGGGIGIFKYGWPTIVESNISHNTAMGHPYGDFDGGTERGGNGDGGGIGVFQAYPSRRSVIEHDLGFWNLIDGTLATRLRQAWDSGELRDAKRKWIHVHKNKIHNNRAEMSGGGVYGTVLTQFSMHNNEIYENEATQQDGGGLAITYGSRLRLNGSSLSQNRIVNNEANRYGGGIYIRSSKASVGEIEISNNRISSSSGQGGGGIAVLSIPEILTGVKPIYDIIQHVVFDHIDVVELELEDATVTRNTAGDGAGLYVYKDMHEYYSLPRLAGVGLGIIAPLDIHLRVDPESGVSSNISDDIFVFKIETSLSGSGSVPLEYEDSARTIIEMTF